LLTILSLTIVATLKAVGLILAIGLLIAPGAIAFLTTRQFRHMLIVAVIASNASLAGGVYLSFWIGSDPGPTVILVLTALFIAAFISRMIRNRATQSSANP
jgi:manganese/iron transport system permease protein